MEETVGAPTTSADVDATPPAEEVIPAIGVDRLFEDLPPRDVPDAKGTIFDSRDQRISARGVVVPVGTPITPVAIDAAGESAVDFVVKEVDRDGEALATLWDGRVPPGSSGDPVSLRRELSGFFLVEARAADRQNGSAWREWVVTVEPEAAAALVASREVTTSGAPVDLRIENRGSVTLEFGVGLRVQLWDEASWESVESGPATKSSGLDRGGVIGKPARTNILEVWTDPAESEPWRPHAKVGLSRAQASPILPSDAPEQEGWDLGMLDVDVIEAARADLAGRR